MKRTLSAAILLLLAVLAAFASLSCQRAYSGPAESVTAGIMANAGDVLIFVAGQQMYFTDNGLNVTLKTYDNGLAATNAMLRGEADLAYATEFVVVGKALQGQKTGIVAVYSKNETVGLVGRKDQRIEVVSDLKGRRIGLARGTINEFYLGRLLNLNGLAIGDVTLVDIKITELEDAFGAGHVDAVVAGSRNLYPVIQEQAGKVFLWPVHSGQPAYGTLVARNDWVVGHHETLKRLLKSLSGDEYMARVWSEYQFSLSLDQSLILAMEDEARWMINNDLTAQKTVPDFLDYIYEDALREIRPEAVNIIR